MRWRWPGTRPWWSRACRTRCVRPRARSATGPSAACFCPGPNPIPSRSIPMPSKPELVCQAIAQALTQHVPLVAGRVYRDRTDAFTREESPALLVECIDEDTQPLGGPAGPWRPVGQMDRNDLRVALTVVVRDAQWQQVADAVRVQAHAAVMHLAGPLA